MQRKGVTLCAKMLIFQIMYQYPIYMWHNLWKLLTINLKDKSFHDSIELRGLYLLLKWILHHAWKKFSDFQCSDYWENHFGKLPPPPLPGMIWSLVPLPMQNNSLINLCTKIWFLLKRFFFKKRNTKETSWNSNLINKII